MRVCLRVHSYEAIALVVTGDKLYTATHISAPGSVHTLCNRVPPHAMSDASVRKIHFAFMSGRYSSVAPAIAALLPRMLVGIEVATYLYFQSVSPFISGYSYMKLLF